MKKNFTTRQLEQRIDGSSRIIQGSKQPFFYIYLVTKILDVCANVIAQRDAY